MPSQNNTGINIPGMQSASDFLSSVLQPNTTEHSLNQPLTPSTTSKSGTPVVPFSAFGGGPVVIQGSVPGNGYGGPAYTSGTDPKILGDMTSAFGEGAGDSLFNFLQSGAGYNPQIAEQLLSSFAPQISQGSAKLASEFGAAGMGNSSSAGIAQGTFQAEMANSENQILANLYEQGSNNYMNMLMGITGVGGGATNTGSRNGSTGQTISDILGGISMGAGALSAAGVGGTSGTLATILSILGGL